MAHAAIQRDVAINEVVCQAVDQFCSMSHASTDPKLTPPSLPAAVAAPLNNRELGELLVRQYGLHEGHYELWVEFMIGSGNMGPSPEAVASTAFVSFSKVGLTKVRPRPRCLSMQR